MTESSARPDNDVAAQSEASAKLSKDTRSSEATAPETASAPVDHLVEATREAAEFKDKLLRTLAEMENLRRRTEREVADARLYGISGFARDVLGVVDNMDRALKSLNADMRAQADSSVKALLDGVELTERELLKVLEKHGIRKFEPALGEKFDPNLHQAMYEVPDPSLPGGTIAQLVQAGYKISERMLRPALVAVVKHPAKPQAERPAAGHPSANGSADASVEGPSGSV